MKTSFLRSPRFFLFIILIVSFILRWGLVLHGGQFYNPDEYRYLTSRIIAKDLQKGHYTDAMTEATAAADHLGFKLIGVLPALVEIKHGEDPRIPSHFFSIFSWLNIILIWLLARRLGSDEKEALSAVLLAACSNALFYYSPHLFPYDIALSFGLATLYIAVQKNSSIWTSLLTGFLGFLTFFTYNGYWTLTAFALIVHVLNPAKLHPRVLIKSILAAIGLITPFILLVLVSRWYGNDLLNSYLTFSQGITNGLFSEGWSMPIKYLWSAEYSILIVFLILTCFSIASITKNPPQRILIALAGLCFIYGCFVLSSVVLHKFVVYGRLARQLVPFLALASAFGLRIIQDKYRLGHVVTTTILTVALLQAAVNFRRPFLLYYPRDFAKKVQEIYPDFLPPRNMTFFYTANKIDVGPYKAYNIKFIFPLPEAKIAGDEELLLSAINPISSYPPFRFDEGFTPQEREAFPTINMMVTRIKK